MTIDLEECHFLNFPSTSSQVYSLSTSILCQLGSRVLQFVRSLSFLQFLVHRLPERFKCKLKDGILNNSNSWRCMIEYENLM